HYQPGEFYRRELPCLLAAIEAVSCPVEALIIDGYVWLDGGKPGLGAHLHRSLDEKVPVIGVAKNPFSQASDVELVYRGTSKRPLYVSAAGVDLRQAAQTIYRMHGEHRLPTLLKRVDRLCRDGLSRN
ncbi:MAG: endonuclease V, partial [Verrucomicrobiota bacterium]